MQLISLFQYLLTVAETHDSSQQPTDFNILPPFIAMWKLYGVVLNEAGANFQACTKKLCRDIVYLI